MEANINKPNRTTVKQSFMRSKKTQKNRAGAPAIAVCFLPAFFLSMVTCTNPGVGRHPKKRLQKRSSKSVHMPRCAEDAHIDSLRLKKGEKKVAFSF